MMTPGRIVLLEKTKVTTQSRNSMMTELLKLYETNRTANRARSTKRGMIQVNNAHLAILGGATPQGYESMWVGTGGGSGGLQSRMLVVTTTAPKMPIRKTATDFSALEGILELLKEQAEREGWTVRMDSEASEMLRSWWESKSRDLPAESRADDMVKRLLIVLAVTNDTNVIDRGLMTQGIQFGDYLIAVRERFNRQDSYSWVQSFELAIGRVAQKRKTAMTFREFEKYTNARTKPGGLGAFLQAWRNVITAGVLRQDGKTRSGTAKYRL